MSFNEIGAMTPWRASEKSLNIQWFLTSSPGLDLSLNKIEGKFAFDFYIMVLMKPRTQGKAMSYQMPPFTQWEKDWVKIGFLVFLKNIMLKQLKILPK